MCKICLFQSRFQANLHISVFNCVDVCVLSFYLYTSTYPFTICITKVTPPPQQTNNNSKKKKQRKKLASQPGTRTTWRHFVSHFVCVEWFLSFGPLLLCDACALHILNATNTETNNILTLSLTPFSLAWRPLPPLPQSQQLVNIAEKP